MSGKHVMAAVDGRFKAPGGLGRVLCVRIDDALRTDLERARRAMEADQPGISLSDVARHLLRTGLDGEDKP